MKKLIPTIAILAIVFVNFKEKEKLCLFKPIMVSVTASAAAVTTFEVDPATELDEAFWASVQGALQKGPVDVVFAQGTYTRNSTMSVKGIGHKTNRLTLKASGAPGSSVFTGTIAKLFGFTDCRNLVMSGLKFTGDVTGYAVTFTTCKNITVDNCYFVDLTKVFYGALGVHTKSDNAIVKNCTFSRVGVDSHAHMVYGAYNVTRLKLVNNSFTDCAGAFVRFRGDISTHGVVYGNKFKSTGTYAGGVNPGFIEVPLFNNVDPGDERFGTSFMITKNSFDYSTSGKQATRFALVFHHSGFNPADRINLITPEDAEILNNGTVEQKRAILLAKPGIDANEVRFAGNTNINVEYNVLYRCQGGYGAIAPFTGIADIESAVRTSGVAATEAEALAFYDELY